jgi:hypothetical protein
MVRERDSEAVLSREQAGFWASPAGLWLPVALYAGFIFALSSVSMPPILGPLDLNDKIKHGALYAVFAALVARAFTPSLRVYPLLFVLATVALVSAYGVSDEFHQSFVPGRSPDVLDWLADTVAALLVSVAFAVRKKA